MQQITPFNFHGHSVRVVTVDGEPWFVLNDLVGVLGIQNVGNVLARLADDQKGSIRLADGTPGNPNRATVNESGMWTVVLRSDSPAAEPVRRWVTDEVLPAIRKHGGYLTPEATEAALTDPDFIIRLATDLKTERARRAELEAKTHVDAPKVIFADAVAASHTSILVGELAKILRGNGVNIGQNRLFKWMRDGGYLIRRKGTDYNMPTQYAMELGLFEIKETAVTHSDGHISISKTPKVTGKGQNYFVAKFLEKESA